jgi:mycofactocin system glycosyltransferase
LPTGFRIALDPRTRRLDGTTLCGGQPSRVMRLTAAGLQAWDELQRGPVQSGAAGTLGRRLTDAGLAHPRPPLSRRSLSVMVVVPVRDRHDMLARCLAAQGRDHPVVVVDDGSASPAALARICADHEAALVHRANNGGPGAARNTALSGLECEIVAFLDSDCVPPAGWIDQLTAHLADPLVAAVAPRVVALAPRGGTTKRAVRRGILDLGEMEARVVPGSRVAFVPTAALVVRRSALMQVARGEEVFDPRLRYGEDLDVIWRLHEAGWRIRYDPSVEVSHEDPAQWPAVLARRFHYGTAAAPLAVRHPHALPPLVLQPLPALTVAALLTRRPVLATVSFAASILTMRRVLASAGVPTTGVVPAALRAVHRTWVDVGRYTIQFAAPLVAVAIVVGGGGRLSRPWSTRVAAASLLVGSCSSTWIAQRPAAEVARATAEQFAADIAYGVGVYTSCLRTRTATPLRPRLARSPSRAAPIADLAPPRTTVPT